MNNIHGKKELEAIIEVWKKLTKEVSNTVDVLERYKKAADIPSDYVNKINAIKEAQDRTNKTATEALKVTNKAIDQEKKAVEIRNKRIKAFDKFDKQELAAIKKRESQVKKESDLRQRLLTQKKKEEAASIKAAQLSKKLGNEYNKQSAILDELRLKYKHVALVQGESSKSAINLKNQITKLDSKLKRVDASVGQFGRNVGNYPKQMGGAIRSLKSFAAAFGFTSAVFILAQTVRNAIGVFKEFDQSQADLSAILGRNKDEIKELTEQAKQLGATTAFTATQVAQLQLELAKLGFNDTEILAATLGIENLAIATGVDAARAAKLGGSALRGFALEASNANEVAATLAVSTTKSALTFESLETSLPKVSSIAKAFGFTIEDTTALLGGLANAGFESSIAGTSLRQIFLQLADSNGKLAKRLGGGAKNFDELIGQFKKLEKEGISLAEAFNLTNARSVAAFKVFLSGADDLTTLRDSIVDVEDELDILAEQKLNSVQGRITLLNSAWEGWILNLDNSGEAAESIKKTLEFLTKNLDKILTTIVKLGKAFFIYKAILIAVSLGTRLYTAGVVALRIAKIALAGGIGKATRAMKLFNLTTKANPIAILISVLSGGLAVFLAFGKGVKETSKSFLELKKNADLATDAIVKNTLFQIEEQLRQIDQESENQKEANKNKIDLLNDSIKDQENGTASLYDTLEDITKAGEEEVTKTLEEKLAERKVKYDNYYRDLAKFAKGEIDKQPILPEDDGLSSREQNILEKRNSIRTDSEKQLIERLKALRLKFTKLLNKEEIEDLKKGSKKKNDLEQKIAEQDIQNKINVQKRIIANKENSNRSLLMATDKKVVLELQLERLRSDFIINNSKSTHEEVLLAEKKFQDAFATIVINGQRDRDKINERSEEDNSLEEDDFGIDTRLHLINELVAANQGTFDELAKLYDEDLEAFLALAKAKLGVSEKFAEQKLQLEQALTDQSIDLAVNALNTIFEAQLNKLDEEQDNAESAAETALLFAGDNAAAQAEIQEQLVERKEEIEEKRLAVEKKSFLFNQAAEAAKVVIDTLRSVAAIKAQAAILAANPITAALAPVALAQIPLVIATGGIATGAILAQTIPAFKDGVRDFEGGHAFVGDGGVSEIITTKDGVFKTPSTDTLVNLPKGANVYKNENEFNRDLSNILNSNGILNEKGIQPIIVNKNNNDKLEQKLDILNKTIKNKKGVNISFDKNGMNTSIQNGLARTKLLNNRGSFKGSDV